MSSASPSTETASASARKEFNTLFALSAPITLAQVGSMLMGVVDTMMIARVGVPELAAVAIASTWVWSSTSLAQGIVHGMDPIVSQAHGSGDHEGVALALQRGLVLAVLVSIPLMLLWAATGTILEWLGQDPEVAALSQVYILARLPSALGFLIFIALRQYLAGRGITRPAMWIMLVGNGVNILLNWILIFGHLGFPPLGLFGAGIATGITNILLPLALWAWIRFFRLHEGAWRTWDRRSVELAGLGRFLRLGFPVGVQLALEANAFTLAMIMVGWMGVAELAAHQVVMNMASLTFMFPLGISIGAGARVGHLIGAKNAAQLRLACWMGLLMGGGIMTIAAAIMVIYREALPRFYIADIEVVALSALLLPIAAAFQIADGLQVVGAGLMRGMGKPQAGAVVNLIGFYVIGLPLAYAFAIPGGMGLAGIWWGLAAGIGGVAIMLCVWVYHTSGRPLEELSVDTH